MEMEKITGFPVKDIVIMDEYRNTPPKAEKMEHRERLFLERGELPLDIVINDDNVLLDGYMSYLLAVKHGIEQIDVKRGWVEIIEAAFRPHPDCKAYRWRVPVRLLGQFRKGDKALVSTRSGTSLVTVLRVLRLQTPPDGEPVKYVRKKV